MCVALPEGSIDPLYEHRCNIVADPELAKASKADLQAKMIELDGSYRRSEELQAAGRTREALEQIILYQLSIAKILSPTHHVVLDARLRSASIRSQLSQYDAALEEAKAVLTTREDCLGVNDPFTLEALSLIAQLLERMGESQEALQASTELLSRSRAHFDSLTPEQQSTDRERKSLLKAQWNLAATQYRSRRFKEAVEGAQRVLALASGLAPDDIDRYELTNIAWYVIDRVAFISNNVDAQRRAIEGLSESYRAMRAHLGGTHSRTLPLLANLGFAMADVNPAQAVNILGDYIAIVEGKRQLAALPDERRILLEGRANTYQRFAFAAHDAKQAELAFFGIEWSKGRSLRDDLALKSAMREALLMPDEANALDRLHARIVELQSALDSTGLASGQRQAAERALLEATRNYESRLQLAQTRNPRLQIATHAQIESPDNAKDLLKSDEVFISYLTRRVDGPHFEVLIAVLEPNSRLTLAGPISTLGLEQTIASWTRILSTPGGLPALAASDNVELFQIRDAFFLDVATRSHEGAKKVYDSGPVRQVLSEKLLPPEVRAIASKYRRWIISPGGMLWSVPFEALKDADGLVLDTRIVRYIHSWTMFTLLNQTVKPNTGSIRTPLLAIGDAKYSDEADPTAGNSMPGELSWPDLKFSKIELDRAASLYDLTLGKTCSADLRRFARLCSR